MRAKLKNRMQNQRMIIYKFLTLFKMLLCRENLKKKEKQKKQIKFQIDYNINLHLEIYK